MNLSLGGGVGDMFLVEVAAHLGRLFLGAAQTSAQRLDHVRFVFGALAAGVGLDVLVQQLVRVEFGTVPRQKEQRDAALLRRQLALDPFPMMHRVTIHD